MRKILTLLLVLAAGLAHAQNESKLHAEFRDEWDRIANDCPQNSNSALHTFGCRFIAAFTDHPLHIAVGSIAPQNGFGAGGAFSYATDFKDGWRVRWSVDAVGSANGSWRAGWYFKGFPTPSTPTIQTQPLISAYVQAISLNQINFFGLGNSTTTQGRALFGMREVIPGASLLYPVLQKTPLHLALFGEFNGRFVALRGRHGQTSPSIEQLYTEAEAPGLTRQPGFLQAGEGIRMRPSLFHNNLKLGYSAEFQQFYAPNDSTFNFRRLNLDFSHKILLHRTTVSPYPNDKIGPNGNPEKGAKASFSRNLEGSLDLDFSLSESIVPAGHFVPFYFQPTMGGSNINGARALSSYQDYRFRAPNTMLMHAAFEHSLWTLPLGFAATMDYGKVALTRGDLDFSHLRHSFGVGVTVRGENIPELWLLFAWGGNEGTHTIANINPALLGGAGRPSLF